jgi:hypothetical protein
VILASRPHYAAHLEPIAAFLPPELDVTLVASYHDLCIARRRGLYRIVLSQHGAGQSYGGDRRSAHNPAYPGGADNGGVGLFLVPNTHAASRWQAAYPKIPVEIIGCPRLDALPARAPGHTPVVAVAFHWDCSICPETRSALPWIVRGLRQLAGLYTVIGHGHPRRHDLGRFYAGHGIEHVSDFDEVCRRADLLVADNTSALFEFAATGRPVVVLDPPTYRRDVEHGLRFWEAASIGVRVAHPDELVAAVERALALRAEDIERREEALDIVYAFRTGSAARAARIIEEWSA